MKNCPYCGTKLMKTPLDEEFCSNCGIIPSANNSEDLDYPEYVN